ncbi:mini-chromosome maintenance complex-binding protein isoform X3 [Petaurus breviceps papuanus]|uniref:mini-chromosome maintenance complex-binding protein isoform X3 n=1 Tax=Petaurus breviceps papuanus TaxID=3040969 RepID=UPI0036D848DF
MPCGDDWLNHPLGIVQGFFAQNGLNSDWEKKVTEYFKEKLKENNATKWVPSLNDVPLHYLKPNSFVKFRCMVQDMFDPEFYMGVYETVDPNTKARVLHFGKYRDIAECGPQQEVDLNSTQTTTLERQTFYCVPVPGESVWVKEAYISASQARVSPSTSYTPSRHKRSYEDDEDMDLHPSKQKDQHTGLRHTGKVGGLHGYGEPKRLETEASAGQHLNSPNCTPPLDLNFPLPGEKGPACLVKVYENWDCFKVNDVLEVYGILSVDPVLSILNNEERDSSLLDPMECMDTLEEQRVHSPPASLVPRIHVILAQKLQHINPLLPAYLKEEESKSFISGFMSELSPVRAELLGFLTHALLGDSLAAEYLILHLISTVYARRDVLPLGKFTVNLSGCPRNSTFTEHIYQIIQQLVPASDCQVHLQPQIIPPNMEEYMSSLLTAVLPSVLNKFRIYLTLLRLLDYSISDEVTKAVEDDFVEMRKNDPQSITADDLHRLLVVARFLSLSAGQTTLSRERWLRAKQLESLRKTRLQQQNCVNGNEL